ncbi:DUF1343 domain-containing protein [Acholeplasma equirhinis]|uniref:exo-beta-N-acetylmuramidase NamZ family protein n=1 Tax=Acholeplasma equirhinis TaxID=555393 RepID=UPI00197AD63B|nr:DUF1343 domain-containing protein [Acholeplasma equirhinis]MBN3490761.1 DUF1343 domain-containing protein [Acholeplasma equirhinis]
MIKLGIDRIDEFKALFEGKKVGLITNPTGVDSNLVHTADILKSKVNLTKLYGPEHGIFGNAEAGEHVESYLDERLGLYVYSLYGKTRRLSKEMLEDVDVLCYDIQDVGLRFYTYIYTMAYAMMAAKEFGLKFVVFDRPNPLGGIKVEGNLLNLEYRSFVGYYSIPQRYGLTVGELALLFNKEFKIGCDLTVIPMEGYDRSKDYLSKDLPWLAPSPNLPTHDSAYLYAATCVFEGTNVSEGRGTTRPFSIVGAPFINAFLLADKVKALNLPGLKVRPIFFTPTFSKHQGVLSQGIELFLMDKETIRPIEAGYQILRIIQNDYPEFEFREPWREGQKQMIDLLTGNDDLRMGKKLEEIFESFKKDQLEFIKIKERYHLYA